MNKRIFLLDLLVIVSIFIVYRSWFTGGAIIGGDWPYFWRETLLEMRLWPSLWALWQGNGLGGVNPLLGLQLFQSLLIVPFVNWLGLPWEAVYKIGWFGFFLTLSFFSPVILWRSIFPRFSSKWPGFLTGLIYSTNTYILMVTGGGQMGVALAYSLAPLVLANFMRRYVAWSGLMLAFQLMIDPRIAYVTMVGVGIYFISNFKFSREAGSRSARQISNVIRTLVVPLVIAVGVNAFWIIPMIVMRNNPLESLGAAYTSIESIKFFSFADFSHTLSFLHPNWSENLFGKTYFLQPEFLVLPVLAFASLLFVGQRTESSEQITKNKQQIVFFVLLALAGAFLAKGANEPFGNVYLWLFDHIPGFVMFRDPTKWYVLIAISYSVLIPFTLEQFVIRRKIKTILITLFISFWLFTIREATLGQLGGTFTKRNVPQEYVETEKFIVDQPDFFRTLWVPRQTRFAFVSGFHQAVEAEPLFAATNSAQLLVSLNSPFRQKLIEELGIKYIIVPSDPLGEIFVSDRKYDAGIRGDYKNVLDSVPWLRKVIDSTITIYKTPNQRDRFWLDEGKILFWQPTNGGYALKIQTSRSTRLYFSENYNESWRAKIGSLSIVAQRSATGLNYFEVPSGDYEADVSFKSQKYADWGIMVSLSTLSLMMVFMIKFRI